MPSDDQRQCEKPQKARRQQVQILTLFLCNLLTLMRRIRRQHYLIMDANGLHHYQVMFEYRGKPYTCEFLSSAEITPETNKLVAWGIADDAIKERMLAIPNRQKGSYPHSIVITGEFGSITVKE